MVKGHGEMVWGLRLISLHSLVTQPEFMKFSGSLRISELDSGTDLIFTYAKLTRDTSPIYFSVFSQFLKLILGQFFK